MSVSPGRHLAFTLTLALLTGGCGAPGEAPGGGQERGAQPRDRASRDGGTQAAGEDTLRVLSSLDERLFGPYWSVNAKFLMFLPLVRWDGEGGIEPGLARGWEHTADRRHWTYHLRSDVRWHDGLPVTARDVEFSLELAAHPEVLYDDAWHGLDSITVHDDTTITLHYARPEDGLDHWHVYWPEHLLGELDPENFWEWEFWTRPVGNGPYRYVRHVPKTVTEVEANPDFYAGEPAIDRVLLKFGSSSALTELRAGNVDLAPIGNKADIPALRADARFRVYHALEADLSWRRAIIWNAAHPPFADARVRRALTRAIDRPELLRLLNLPESLRYADVPYTGRQYTRGELPPPLPHDPARARALLDSAGWARPARGGPRFRFEAITRPEGEERQAAVYVQAALREIGVEMSIVTLDQALHGQRVDAGEFQAAFRGYGNFVERHLEWLGSDSRIGYENREVARLLEAVKETADPAEVDSLYRATWPILRREVPVTFLYPRAATVVAHRRVRGLRSPYRADPMLFMEELWIEKGASARE